MFLYPSTDKALFSLKLFLILLYSLRFELQNIFIFYRLYLCQTLFNLLQQCPSNVDFYLAGPDSTITPLFRLGIFYEIHNLQLGQRSHRLESMTFCYPALLEIMISAPHSCGPWFLLPILRDHGFCSLKSMTPTPHYWGSIVFPAP